MLIIIFVVGCIAIAMLFLHIRNKELVHARMVETIDKKDRDLTVPGVSTEPTRGVLSSWLYRAGFRSPIASTIFITATLVCCLIAILFVVGVYRYGLIAQATDALYGIPGGVGNVMVPFALALPWLVVVILSLLPTLLVRSVRRRRTEAIQQDLPLLLDLLNTLSQAGIGFDSALDRILDAQDQQRH